MIAIRPTDLAEVHEVIHLAIDNEPHSETSAGKVATSVVSAAASAIVVE